MNELQKKNELKKMKFFATSLFVVMVIIYIIMVYLNHIYNKSWIGYVEAFSEAAMVGALADWFAVVALFGYPLGLKFIPHTNLIEKGKKDLGKNLGDFVKNEFLSPEIIKNKLNNLNISLFVADWLKKSDNQKELETFVLNFTKKTINDLNDEQLINFLSNKSSEILKQVPYPKVVAKGITYAVQNNKHVELLEYILNELEVYLDKDGRKLLIDKFREEAGFFHRLVSENKENDIVNNILKYVKEVKSDKNHFIWEKLTNKLKVLSHDIENDVYWKNKLQDLSELATPDNLNQYAKDAWNEIKNFLNKSIDAEDSFVKEFLHKNVIEFVHKLENDKELTNNINNRVRTLLEEIILNKREVVADLISEQVSGWENVSEKFELQVGKDLQFIRINGTLIGGLIGFFIHLFTQLLFK